MKILGIDPGKTNMGLCLLNPNEGISGIGIHVNLHIKYVCWKLTICKSNDNFEKITQLLQLEIDLDQLFTNYKPDVVFHEGISFGEKFGVAESGMVQYIIQRTCINHGIPFTTIANMTIRRFLGISKGEKTKDLISLAIYKKFNIELPSQDERDAFAIAKCGEAIMNKEFELTAPKVSKKKVK